VTHISGHNAVVTAVLIQVGFAKSAKISALDLQLFSNCGHTVDFSVNVSHPAELVYWGRLKTRDWKTRHQLAGVENEGINCMDGQWDNFCNLLK